MKNIYLCLFLSTIFISCNQDNSIDGEKNVNNKKVYLTLSEYKSIAYDTPKELSENDILKAAKTFSMSEKEKGETKGTTIKNITITKKEYISENSHSPKSKSSIDSVHIPMYTVEIESENSSTKDIAIISGDERTSRLLAYYSVSDSAYINTNICDVVECTNMLVDMAKYAAFDELKVIRQLQDSLRNQTINKISTELNISENQILFEDIKDQIAIIDNNTKATIIRDEDANSLIVSSRYGPWCDVRWDNGMPYNRLMPQSCPNNWLWDNRYPISSIVVAVAQSFCFFKPNLTIGSTNINWNYLKEKPEIYETTDYFGQYVADPLEKRNMVATLMKYIGEQCSVTYYCDGSSVNVTNVINFLSRMGIAIDGQQSLNITNLKNSILNLKPVIMYGQTNTGGGHHWIADGLISVISYEPSGIVTTQYLHANMGYGKSYTGYFLLPSNNTMSFNTGFAHFEKNIVMYPNMRRK